MVRKISILLPLFFWMQQSFSQELQFSNLIKLPGAVNSSGEESMPLLSPDQTKLFFVRSVYDGNTGGRFAGQDIWCSEKTAAGWKKANNKIQYLNNKENNVLIGINSDGTTLYTMNSSPSTKLEGIYFSRMNDGGTWTRPDFIPIQGIENEDFVGMYVSPDYDVIFLTMRGSDSRGEEDIYFSVKSSGGTWSRPRNIGPTINTSGYEISPFLSADKKKLYFASNGHGGYGDADIFYCERLYNSWETWSAPVNLGPLVNSKKFDAYFSVYGDSVAFFTSNRENQFSDIFKVNVSSEVNILPAGKKYVSEEEWNSIIGATIVKQLTFDNDQKTLTSGQKELLYYIAKKLLPTKDVNIHLLVKEQESSDATRMRLREIYGELRQEGLDGFRIYEQQKESSIKTSNRGVIEILLFK
jgi:hypothetical protein